MRALGAAALLCASTALAGDQVFHLTPHGSRTGGVSRDATVRVGHCMQCHPTRQAAPFSQARALFGPNDNSLCFTCHSAATPAAVYQGSTGYGTSAHWTSTLVRWPGPVPPARPAGDGGKCLNCHNPHGARDGLGLVPNQGILREEALCLACHDASGPSVKNVNAELAKAAAHPVIPTSGVHLTTEGGASASFGTGKRHAECEDCHNPHRASATAPLAGVSRVRPNPVAAGAVPTFSYLPPSDTSAAFEYELCFKCHSSWTTLPAGAKDKAFELNPNNESFHPVRAAGKNTTAKMAASLAGGAASPALTTASTIACSDCHASEAIPRTVAKVSSYAGTAVKGPHGSNASAGQPAYSSDLLRGAYRMDLKPRSTTNNYNVAEFALCTICHSPAPFADRSKNTRADTNFDLHGFHMADIFNNPAGGTTGTIATAGAGQGNAICRECHYDPHGTRGTFWSNNRSYARLVSFSPNITGPNGTGQPVWSLGSCSLRCHGMDHTPETY
ncbi:MAG: cytochrome c3 family protein [Myxococcaceae bacterium]